MAVSLHQEKKKCLIAEGVLNTYAFPSSEKVLLKLWWGNAKFQTFSFPTLLDGTDWFSLPENTSLESPERHDFTARMYTVCVSSF